MSRTDPISLDAALHDLEAHARGLPRESDAYLRFHRERLRWTTSLIQGVVGESERALRILDVGNSFQTLLFERVFPGATIETLGFHDDRYALRQPSAHYQYDLNRSYDRESWPRPAEPFDLITLLEVIEHLHVSPQHLLAQLHAYLNPNGVLVISTPNAVSLQRRRALLLGRNPYERIRVNHHSDPGHIREYTRAELTQYGRSAGFLVENVYLHDPYALQPRYQRFLYRWARRAFPALRNSLTCVFRWPESDDTDR